MGSDLKVGQFYTRCTRDPLLAAPHSSFHAPMRDDCVRKSVDRPMGTLTGCIKWPLLGATLVTTSQVDPSTFHKASIPDIAFDGSLKAAKRRSDACL